MIKEILLSGALLATPLAGEAIVEPEPIEEQVENIEAQVEENKIQFTDKDGNVYWIDFNNVDWSAIDIDWSNLNEEQFVDIMVSVATQAMSPELLALLASVGSIALVCIGLLIKAYKEKARANMTSNECADKVIDKVENVLNNKITQLFKEKVEDQVNDLVNASKVQSEATLKLLKVQALMQQNTPEAKQAIINELVESGKLDEKVAQESAKIIAKQVAEEKQHKEEILDKIESLKSEDNGTTI